MISKILKEIEANRNTLHEEIKTLLGVNKGMDFENSKMRLKISELREKLKNMTDKYRYMIYPERTYVFEFEDGKVEVLGHDLVNIIPDILRKKYLDAFFNYEQVPFDNQQEGVV